MSERGMSERDDLAETLSDAAEVFYEPFDWHESTRIADAILAAGYRRIDHTEYALDHKRADFQFTDDIRLKCQTRARIALEAALPTLLSHEREETRLAHLDAMVNAATVDRLEAQLVEAFDYGWREGKGIPTPSDIATGELHLDDAARATFNPYRTPVVGA